MFPPTSSAVHPANSPSRTSWGQAGQEALDAAKEAIGRGDIRSAVHGLSARLTDPHAFHNAILDLLHSPACRHGRQALIEETLVLHPSFDLDAHDRQGKTVLDLAVRDDDRAFARYLLNKGAKPERISLAQATPGMQAMLTMWRRRTLLYAHHNEQDRRSWTSLDRELHQGLHEKVRSLLKSEIAKKGGVCKAWEDALAAGQKDFLRALLVVGTPEELRELTKRQTDAGKWIKALSEDPGLSAALKEFPYQSAKRGEPEHFNQRATFLNTAKRITCRHLAAYLQEEQAPDPHAKVDYGTLKSTADISKNVKPDVEKTFHALKAQATETHLIHNAKFGQFLAGQFKAMEREDKLAKQMLLESTNHTMNLTLKIKEKDGRKSYVVKFYDPNDTTTHTRLKAASPQEFEVQTIGDYLARSDRLGLYYPEANGMSKIFVRPEEGEQAVSSSSSSSSAGRTLTTCIDPKDIDGIALWHLMDEGFAGNLEQLHERFNALTEEQRIQLLSAKGTLGKEPPLYASMQSGHAEAIRAYGRLLASIPVERRIELLAGRQGNGTPALLIAMQKGHAEAIRAYGELLASIPLERRIDLIAGKRADGALAISLCMKNGHADAIRAYGELLASIPAEQRFDLIAGETANGLSAFFVAMHEGHAEAVEAYGELVKSLPPDKQADLLLAKVSRGLLKGQSGLRIALQQGHIGAANEQLQLLTRLAPELSADKRTALWNELKAHEKHILHSMPNVSLSQERDKLRSLFAELKTALSR